MYVHTSHFVILKQSLHITPSVPTLVQKSTKLFLGIHPSPYSCSIFQFACLAHFTVKIISYSTVHHYYS